MPWTTSVTCGGVGGLVVEIVVFYGRIATWQAARQRALSKDRGRDQLPPFGKCVDAPSDFLAAFTRLSLGADAVVVDELATIPAVVALSRRARRLVAQNLVIAGAFITVLVAWDLIAPLPLPLGVAGHEGSTVIVGLNGLRLLREAAWPRAAGDAS